MTAGPLPDGLPPEFERQYLIETVFLPEARRHRDRLYRDSAQPRFVHYTRAEAALSIIGKKRLWLRNTNSMVDYREIHHGFELLQKAFWNNEAEIEKSLIVACDAYIDGAAKEAIELFNGWWKAVPEGIRTRTYIGSVSEHDRSEDHHGRLSMWRAFGSSAAARVALVFQVPRFSPVLGHLSCLFNPVSYLDEAGLERVMREIVANINGNPDLIRTMTRQEIVGWLFTVLVIWVTCLKHEGFVEEREWRLIYSPSRAASSLMEEELQTIGGIPQLIYKLPLDCSLAPELADLEFSAIFDRIIIGPSSQPWVMYEAFTKALIGAGVEGAADRVITSGIPLRSF